MVLYAFIIIFSMMTTILVFHVLNIMYYTFALFSYYVMSMKFEFNHDVVVSVQHSYRCSAVVGVRRTSYYASGNVHDWGQSSRCRSGRVTSDGNSLMQSEMNAPSRLRPLYTQIAASAGTTFLCVAEESSPLRRDTFRCCYLW